MLRVLSKSKLIAYRQCPKRLWLEIHRPDLREDSAATERSFQIGYQVGDIARRLYDPANRGSLIDVQTEGYDAAFDRSTALLETSEPIFEAGYRAESAMAFADVMIAVDVAGQKAWRMVEVKSSTSVKDYHRDDLSIQAFVARAAGVPLVSISVAHIDSSWAYPGGDDYSGLLVECDLTDESFGRNEEVAEWIHEAQAVANLMDEPAVKTGPHCGTPFACGFSDYCRSFEPQAEYPIEWLPRLQSKAAWEFIETSGISDIRDMPDDHLNERQQRVKRHTLSGVPYFDQRGAQADLADLSLPAYFLDFETIYFAVPIWKGTRPYQQIPFQFSLHVVDVDGALEHLSFLDLSGGDPSEAIAKELVTVCGAEGPVFVYNAAFESARISELADRFPDLRNALLAISDRIFDLLPVARNRYYHPSQKGSWSIKAVLPAVAPDLSYDALDGVRDGGMAMEAFLEAIHHGTPISRREEIHDQLIAYCRLDTFAMIRLWRFFLGQDQ